MLLTNWDPAESVVWGTTWTYTHVAQWAKIWKSLLFDILQTKLRYWQSSLRSSATSGFMDFWRGSQLFHFFGGFELPLSLCDGTNWLCNSLFHAKSNRVRVDKYWQPFKICIVMDSTTICVIKPDFILFLVFAKFFGKMSWT